jgi:hypothetical protein
MGRRWLVFAFAVFQTIWLNVIVPGHQRGIVQLPGSHSSCPDCCCNCRNGPAESNHPKNGNAPAPKPAGCAICFFAAHLSIPPVVDFTLPPHRLLGAVPDEIAHHLFARICFIPFDGRGPPACDFSA